MTMAIRVAMATMDSVVMASRQRPTAPIISREMAVPPVILKLRPARCTMARMTSIVMIHGVWMNRRSEELRKSCSGCTTTSIASP
ncbi:hypothetical protein D3C80_1720210 [compost metagenome]